MLLSIIVPVYNSEKYLKRCLDSIINQTYSNLEIILINDGSTDSSKSICEEYCKKDIRIKMYSQENCGPSSARNIGIKKASGEYIMFVDSDDKLETNILEKLALFIPKYDIVICNYNIVAEDRIKMVRNKIYYNEDFLNFVIINMLWGPVCKLIKKRVIKTYFNQKYKIGEDLLFWYENSKNIKSFKYLDERLYAYYQNQDSLMNKQIIKQEHILSFDIFNKIIEEQYSPYVVDNMKKTYIICYLNYTKYENRDLLKKYKIYKEDYLYDVLKSSKVDIISKLKIIYKIVKRKRLTK